MTECGGEPPTSIKFVIEPLDIGICLMLGACDLVLKEKWGHDQSISRRSSGRPLANGFGKIIRPNYSTELLDLGSVTARDRAECSPDAIAARAAVRVIHIKSWLSRPQVSAVNIVTEK